MGRTINASGDKVPPQEMYEACRAIARSVEWKGGLSWDFSALAEGEIDPQFRNLVEIYLGDVLGNRSEHKGWKLPETTLAYPWIARLFPDAKYIYWVRDPRDCVIGRHVTDDLRDFGVEYPQTDSERERRAISWKYQYEIVKATPQPAHFLMVRFEDFVLNQEEALQRLEAFLEIPLARIIVRRDPVARWKRDDGQHDFAFFSEAMAESGYNDTP